MEDIITAALNSSMFRRIPEIAEELVMAGMSIEDAITEALIVAKRREDYLCTQMMTGSDEAKSVAIEMAGDVYKKLNPSGSTPAPDAAKAADVRKRMWGM